MGEGDFDVVILGTGLVESMTAAALSKAGFKVAHLDVNPYYGGDEASLSPEALIQWAEQRLSHQDSSPYMTSQRAKYTSVQHSPVIPDRARHYSISLCPSLIPSTGPLISSLVTSGVSRYGGYRLLERVGIYDRALGIRNVPGSKEDVFKSKEMSLVGKRRLMRFLLFASGDFENSSELQGKTEVPFLAFLKDVWSLEQQVSEAIAYALAFCVSPEDQTLPALTRLRRYLRSSGRYGASPFLVGHYGGLGEIAQGFCRVSAVNSGVYILGRKVNSITRPTETEDPSDDKGRYVVDLDDFPEHLTTDIIISSPDLLPENLRKRAFVPPAQGLSMMQSVARCIAILDCPPQFPATLTPETTESSTETEEGPAKSVDKPIDTSVIVFPPSSIADGSDTAAMHAFITGEGSMSAPKGKYIAYLSLPLANSDSSASTEMILKPYLDAIISLSKSPSSTSVDTEAASASDPLFTMYYTQHPTLTPTLATSNTSPTVLVSPPIPYDLAECADAASTAAEALFLKIVEVHKARHPESWAVGTTDRKSVV